MKSNFFSAYQYFLHTLSDCSKPKEDSLKAIFGGDKDKEGKDALLEVCEGTLVDEIEDSLISQMEKDCC